jgi:hypothetical protein
MARRAIDGVRISGGAFVKVRQIVGPALEIPAVLEHGDEPVAIRESVSRPPGYRPAGGHRRQNKW